MSDNKLKGGRKGGATFPRVDLKQAVDYAKKLVAKTHTGPQPQNVIYPGVFGVTSNRGGPKASALKQFQLMKGSPSAFQATDLAKSISVAPANEIKPLLIKSLLHVKLFKTCFDTFKGDSISRAKIKQQAASLNVHPESLDEFITIFISSCIYCGLASEEGDNVSFILDQNVQTIEDSVEEELEQESEEEMDNSDEDLDKPEEDTEQKHGQGQTKQDKPRTHAGNTPQKADIQIKIDPSMDPEKLDKLLAVLKKYGQL